MPERYKVWLDEVATMFGGLDICALEMIVSRDSREYIIEVNDSALTLMGDSQEEDRRHITDLVTQRMQVSHYLDSTFMNPLQVSSKGSTPNQMP